jgi:hypothetical protein
MENEIISDLSPNGGIVPGQEGVVLRMNDPPPRHPNYSTAMVSVPYPFSARETL